MTTLEKIRAEIRQLTKTYPFVDHKDTYVKEEDVIDIIDKYAEQECEDAVSREDAIKAECEVCDICGNTRYTKCQYFMQGCNEVKCLRDLPSTRPQEPKTGHWILQPSNKEQGERDFIWWKCSECSQVIFSETEKDRREYHAFCGRCGAKMFEPQESEESDD